MAALSTTNSMPPARNDSGETSEIGLNGYRAKTCAPQKIGDGICTVGMDFKHTATVRG